MTALEIFEFVGSRGNDISRADLTRANEMLIELPLDEVTGVRETMMEGIALTVNDPLYAGDIEPIE